MATPTLVKKLHFEPLILELHCKRVAFHRRLITILLRWSSGDILQSVSRVAKRSELATHHGIWNKEPYLRSFRAEKSDLNSHFPLMADLTDKKPLLPATLFQKGSFLKQRQLRMLVPSTWLSGTLKADE